MSQLVETRKAKGITQKELEQKTGLSQQAISRVEIGKDVIPSLQTLLNMQKALGAS